jgi:hypothetical protein
MSKAAWKPNPLREARRLIRAATEEGYEVTSVEKLSNGSVKVGMKKFGAGGGSQSPERIETPEDLRKGNP